MAKKKHKASLLQGRDGLRFAAMILVAIVVSGIALGVLDKFRTTDKVEPKIISPVVPDITLPPIDKRILAEAKDATAIQRLETEAVVYEHLLACVAYIVPGALQAMGLQDGSVAALRADSSAWRGKPVTFEGMITRIDRPVAIPGVDVWKKTEGMLETEAGETIFFAVLDKVPAELVPGKFARIEGFFYKLRDFKFPTRHDQVPHVVGFALRPGFRSFAAVKELDRTFLSTIADDVETPSEIDSNALYHVTSWLQNQPNDAAWFDAAKVLERRDVEKMLAAGEDAPRGQVFHVRAELYDAQTRMAEPNPLGIEHWTRAWVRHSDQETIQVNIPGRLEGEWRTGDIVVFYGAYLQRYWYEAGIDDQGRRVERIVPLFVAKALLPWKLVDNPANFWIRIALVAVALLLIAAVSFLVLRDRKAEQEVRDRLIEQRRRKRQKTRA
ncbi:MAG TPA: hypothetical protein PKE00_01480 [Planctomycetota bacterium]|nr:hypothetical protein [Planctomycetota bacterium]